MFRMLSLPFAQPQKQPPIGLDITSAAVKLLEIHPHGSKLRVASQGVAPLEEGAISDRRIRDYKAVARSIKRVIDQTQPGTRRAAVAVPTASVITRLLSLPRDLDDDEMEAQVLLEADQHVPYPLHEVAIDFERQPPLDPAADHQPVLLVACRKETTEQLDQLLEEAGLEPALIDVENFALERSLKRILNRLPRPEENQIIAVADIGATRTTLSVLLNGTIIYSRDQLFGGKQLTDEIQRHYGLSRAEAGLRKKKGKLPADYPGEILEPFKMALIQQIERQLQLFHSASAQQKIDHLILAGGCSVIAGLPAMVQKQLGAPAQVANPFVDMLLSDRINPPALQQEAPALMIACGLAMRTAS